MYLELSPNQKYQLYHNLLPLQLELVQHRLAPLQLQLELELLPFLKLWALATQYGSQTELWTTRSSNHPDMSIYPYSSYTLYQYLQADLSPGYSNNVIFLHMSSKTSELTTATYSLMQTTMSLSAN
jgi:hypothetical protein